MLNIFKKFNKKKESVQLDQVSTLLEGSKAYRSDKNNDGIPDYLQRADLISMVATNKDMNQWESDVEKELEEIMMGFRGYTFDASKNKYVPVSPPVMNEIGITKVMQHMKSIINKHTINTFLDIIEIHLICKSSSEVLIRLLANNQKLFQISKSDLEPIYEECDNFAFIVLKRAEGDRQRRHVTDRTKITGSIGSPKMESAI